MTVSAVAFDMGGVLTHTALGGLEDYAAALHLRPGSLSRFFRGDARMASLEVGEITAREFFKYVCVEAESAYGCRIDIQRLAAAAGRGQELNPDMIDLVAEVHRRCATALLTNNIAEAEWRATFPFELFDVVVDSSEVGVRKPDRRIYEELLVRLGRPADEVVFIDDFEENLGPAADLGIRTLLFTEPADCRVALARLAILEVIPS
jgi:epoxide hydrolase-like predicted phosphatase